MIVNKNDLEKQVIDKYLSRCFPDDSLLPDFDPVAVASDIIEMLNQKVTAYNNIREKSDPKLKAYDVLPIRVLADVSVFFGHALNICFKKDDAESDDCSGKPLLGIYDPSSGLYLTNETAIKRFISKFAYSADNMMLDKAMELMCIHAPKAAVTDDIDLIAVNNGIFNYKTKEFFDFSPEYVFTSKSKVNYNEFATNPVIHNSTDNTDWDVESWINELSDDLQVRQLLWELTSVVLRPNVPWNKAAFFYNTKGCNGKGTFLALLKSLVGPNASTSIPMSKFSEQFMLEDIISKSFIYCDENDVGYYIKSIGNFKALVTGDPLLISRKFQKNVPIQWRGFIIQCINDMASMRIADKSDSFYRRQLYIPFEKCFLGGERKYIKEDYLKRTDVLEYVLYKALHTNFYEISNPDACQMLLDEYKEYNDPVRTFWAEIRERLVWDFVPNGFLYDLYRGWTQRFNPSGGVIGKNNFLQDIRQIIDSTKDDMWMYSPKGSKQRFGSAVSKVEPMIQEFNLEHWFNDTYQGRDINKICQLSKSQQQSVGEGFTRLAAPVVIGEEADSVENTES